MFPETIKFIDMTGLVIIAICIGVAIGIFAQRKRCQWWRKQVKAIYSDLEVHHDPASAQWKCRKALGLEDKPLCRG